MQLTTFPNPFEYDKAEYQNLIAAFFFTDRNMALFIPAKV